MKRTSLFLVLAGLLAATTAQASDTPPAADGGEPQPIAAAPVSAPSVPAVTPQERDYYQREAALAQEKRLLDLQLEIHERQQKLRGVSASGSAPSSPPPAVISRVRADSAASAPPAPSRARAASDLAFTIVSIWGADDALQAQVYSHGLRITVREGDSLPGGWVVRKVARTGLVIARGRTERTVVIGG